MPYSRKIRRSHAKKAVRKTFKRRSGAQTRNTFNRSTKPLPVVSNGSTRYINASLAFNRLSPFPQRMWTNMRYSFTTDVQGGAGGECGPSTFFRLNAPNAPGVVVDSGHEAYGWNQLSNIYSRCTVTKAVVTVRGIERSDPTSCIVMYVKRQPDAADPAGQAAYLWQEKQSAWVLMLGGYNGNINAAPSGAPLEVTSETVANNFVMTIDMATLFGIPYKQLINTLDYSCFATNPPANQQIAYLGFAGASMTNSIALCSTAFTLTIDYQTMWNNPYLFSHS